MPTRNVVLSEHQHDLVESLVRSGRYQNASEVLREGLRLIEQREQQDAAKLKALRAAADQGWAAVAAGDYTDVAEDQIEDLINQLSEQASGLARTGK
jgi:antitoxin ParD1/3/4